MRLTALEAQRLSNTINRTEKEASLTQAMQAIQFAVGDEGCYGVHFGGKHLAFVRNELEMLGYTVKSDTLSLHIRW